MVMVDGVRMDFPGNRPRTYCGCGTQIVWTGEGWQHDSATWYTGDVHPASTSDNAAIAAARAYDSANPAAPAS